MLLCLSDFFCTRQPMDGVMRYCVLGFAACSLAVLCGALQASEPETQNSGQPPAARSPWLFIPTFSSNPKLGTSVGGMGAYVTKFDLESQVSIFGLSAQYTNTDSATVAAIARTSFRADHH